MVTVKLDGPDAPVCPLLGLATDRRSHYSYPHLGHRCFAKGRPATTDAGRQATYCLSSGFSACDRYRAWRGPVASGRQREEQRPAGGVPAQPTSATATAASPGPTVVHVLRAGDSLAAIAAADGLTEERLATANGLTLNVTVADGARLVIPLGLPAASVPGAGRKPTARR
jgi:hypothetical protein